MENFKTIKELKEWLKNNDVNKLDNDNENILFYQNNIKIIKYLIENTDINVNQLNKNKLNILFYQNNIKIIKYLIENANINIEYYLNDNININDNCYNYIKSFYEARELEKELNKITSIKKDVKKLNKI